MTNKIDTTEIEEVLFREGVFYEDENQCGHVRDVPATLLLTIRDWHHQELQKARDEAYQHGYAEGNKDGLSGVYVANVATKTVGRGIKSIRK